MWSQAWHNVMAAEYLDCKGIQNNVIPLFLSFLCFIFIAVFAKPGGCLRQITVITPDKWPFPIERPQKNPTVQHTDFSLMHKLSRSSQQTSNYTPVVYERRRFIARYLESPTPVAFYFPPLCPWGRGSCQQASIAAAIETWHFMAHDFIRNANAFQRTTKSASPQLKKSVIFPHLVRDIWNVTHDPQETRGGRLCDI